MTDGLPRVIRAAAPWIGVLAALFLLRVGLAWRLPTQLYQPEEYINLRLAAHLLGDEGSLLATAGGTAPSLALPGETPSVFDWQYQDFDGGTLVVAVTLLSLAAVFGLGPATVKLGAAAWALWAFAGWLLCFRELFPRHGRWVLSIALLGCPLPWLLGSVIHWGNHAESVGFLPWALFLVLRASRLLSDGASARGMALGWTLCLAAGLLSGFGTYFSLLNLLPSLALLLTLPLWLSRGRSAALAAFAVGLPVGFSPWFGRNSELALDSLGAQGLHLADVFGGGRPGLGVETVGAWLSVSKMYPGVGGLRLNEAWAPGAALSGWIAYATLLAVGIAPVLLALSVGRAWSRDSVHARQITALSIVLLTVVVGLPIALGAMDVLQTRRVIPGYAAGTVLVAAAVAASQDLRRGRWLVLGLLFGVVVPNFYSAMRMAVDAPTAQGDLDPWTLYSPPTQDVRRRVGAGISVVSVAAVPRINAILEHLVPRSRTGGAAEISGLARALASGPPGADQAMERGAVICPDPSTWQMLALDSFRSSEEVVAFGAGLTVVCDSEEAMAWCQELPPARLGDCLTGLAAFRGE